MCIEKEVIVKPVNSDTSVSTQSMENLDNIPFITRALGSLKKNLDELHENLEIQIQTNLMKISIIRNSKDHMNT